MEISEFRKGYEKYLTTEPDFPEEINNLLDLLQKAENKKHDTEQTSFNSFSWSSGVRKIDVSSEA